MFRPLSDDLLNMWAREGVKKIEAESRFWNELREKDTAMQTPTQEQLKDPQWWPDGASHYSIGLRLFLQRDFGDWLFYDALSETFKAPNGVDHRTIEDEAAARFLVPRPAKPDGQEWDGEAWPIPVGVTVQNWCGERRTVIAHDGDNIVCRCEEDPDSYRGYTKTQAKVSPLRPLKTQAEREKREVIDAAKQVVRDEFGVEFLEDEIAERELGALYDAGLLRKGGE